MSKASEQLAARAARQAARRRASAPDEETPAPAPRPAQETSPAALRVKPVRITLDLAPVAYRDLQEFLSEAATQLGVARVPAAAVLRALLAELRNSDDLGPRVVAQLPAELDRSRSQ